MRIAYAQTRAWQCADIHSSQMAHNFSQILYTPCMHFACGVCSRCALTTYIHNYMLCACMDTITHTQRTFGTVSLLLLLLHHQQYRRVVAHGHFRVIVGVHGWVYVYTRRWFTSIAFDVRAFRVNGRVRVLRTHHSCVCVCACGSSGCI